jgi:hypothetical protein
MPRPLVYVPALLVAVSLVACGGGDGASSDEEPFPATALASLTSDSGRLAIEVRTSPSQPPPRGELRVQLAVRDATTGAPSTGLSVSVTPWMPAMAHGTSVTPTVAEASPGVYVVSRVDLFMPGTWQLRTDITGPLEDHATLSLEIP